MPETCGNIGQACLRSSCDRPVTRGSGEKSGRVKTIGVFQVCENNSSCLCREQNSGPTDLFTRLSGTDIYRRVEEMMAPIRIAWLSTTLRENEEMSELVVRSLWNQDRSEMRDSSLMVCVKRPLDM